MPKTNPKTTVKTNANVRPTQEPRVGAKNTTKKVVLKDTSIPSISFITTEEFASIPHYMLGRLTYEVINRAIADFNRTIATKYKIINNYSTKYCDEDLRKYAAYKEQENSETDGQYFCTINDLKDLSDLKLDITIRKAIICLRHCKRVKEIRGNPPKLIRYAIVKSTTFMD
ncbi:unnamed protein product [Oppiella nova]|uniref:SKA complex subunit 1 n=1 Tax=Oppiella nova TaxID=334625 RepID=A0A7R9MEM0_9ACAR|nr:unnamed protein product [Oppiella nova]CAG2175968.1 unnamed protein product [Oppiella nova]